MSILKITQVLAAYEISDQKKLNYYHKVILKTGILCVWVVTVKKRLFKNKTMGKFCKVFALKIKSCRISRRPALPNYEI